MTPPIAGLPTPPRASSTPPQHTQPIRIRSAQARSAAMSPPTPLSGIAGIHTQRRAPHHTVHTPYVTRTSHVMRASHNRTRLPPAAQTKRIHNAHTKRARTNRSGRATYSAQALGRLPWFAPCLRRSRRLRPRFDMSFSLGLLSRLKHFCTHWPKPPRHRPFAATKVTEKRAVTPASSACVTPRGRALPQRA